MRAGLASQDLLYVTNGNGNVTVYRYWKQTLIGVLTNFTQPMGECVDSQQNIYITDHATKQILEFAHGATKPMKTFDDSPDAPYACAVDPLTGNLAVANDNGPSQQGNLTVWLPGSSAHTTFTDSKIGRFRGCAYDNHGTLMVTSGSAFAWLPKGADSLIDIAVPGRQWNNVQGIQWDGKFFVIDDSSAIRISLIHGQAYYVGLSSLSYGSAHSSGPFWIYNNESSQQGTQIVGAARESSRGWVMFWHYPAGGNPVYELTHGVDAPFGVAVSLKKH